MAYIPYPQAPVAPNPYQILGQGLQQFGQGLTEEEDRQTKLRQMMEDMTQRRAAALLAQKEAELRAKALEAETNRKADEDQRAHDFRLAVAQGKVVSPTLAKDPTLAQPTRRGEPPPLRAAPGAGPGELPGQSVTGDDATAMMGRALDNLPAEEAPGSVGPLTRDEITQKALEMGQLDAKDYLNQTKADPNDKKHNPALVAKYYGEFLPQVSPLLKRLKNDPTVVSDIAYLGEQQGLGQLEEYQKFIDNLKGGQPWNAATAQRLDLATKGQSFQQENTLRDEYNKKTATFETAFTAYKKLSQALERNNPADAYSAIINYVKTLDPGSTVREAEERLARERSAGGPLGAFGQHLSNLKNGKLTDPIRRNLLEAGRGLVGSEYDTYQQVRKDYSGRVKSYNDRGFTMDPQAVLGNDYGPQYQELTGRDIFNPPKVSRQPPAAPAPSAASHPKAQAVRKVANAILANPKSTEAQKAKAKEALTRLGAP